MVSDVSVLLECQSSYCTNFQVSETVNMLPDYLVLTHSTLTGCIEYSRTVRTLPLKHRAILDFTTTVFTMISEHK